jgi:methionyl-tRNA formyltransferase
MNQLDFENIVISQLENQNYQIQLARNYRKFDRFLFKIHRARKFNLAKRIRKNLNQFLADVYCQTGDVRYLNEFLFFVGKGNKQVERVKDSFYNNIDNNGFHVLPNHPNGYVDEEKYYKDFSSVKKIALLGPPHFYENIFKELKNQGYELNVINIPYNSEPIRNAVLRNKILFAAYAKIKKVSISYKTVNIDPNAADIDQYLNSQNFDLGLSRLGFIVRKNIYGAFKHGVIHDHGAKLPDFRGRSVMEYTLLHGKKITGTIHYIEKGIDTGDVLLERAYPNMYQYGSIKEIRKKYRNDFNNRVLNFFEQMNNKKIQVKKNIFQNGKTWYSIHPKLEKYINKKILRNENFDPFT